MDFKESSFQIIKNHNCPLYRNGDEFKVVGRSISMMGKPTCLTLMSDVMATLIECQGIQTIVQSAPPEHIFNCSGHQSGCPGTIRLKYYRTKKPETPLISKIDSELSAMSEELNNFSIFKTLSDHEVKEIVAYFKIQSFKKEQIILRKGDRGEKLFVILAGEVEIIGDYGIIITTLGRGEIFGEMSLLTGNPVSTKVKAVEDTKTMCMTRNYFSLILSRFSSLQMYFTRLLVRRLAKSNIKISKQISFGISGNLSEITTTELLQTLNMTQKTGVLNLNSPKGDSRISLKDGNIVHAQFKKMTGKAAFFEIVKQKRGNFKFKPGLPPNEMNAPKIADFMYLIMEAMNRIDEASYQPEGP
jgi:CRP-like cAMP-binding protein